MNRLVPVLHERVHQVQGIVELAWKAFGVVLRSRFLQVRGAGRALVRGTMPSHHDEVPLHTVESRNAWKQSPALEAEPLKQFQARFVVSKDQADNGGDPEQRRTADCFFQ